MVISVDSDDTLVPASSFGGAHSLGEVSVASPVYSEACYPTMELLVKLTRCNESMPMLKKLSEPLSNLVRTAIDID